MILAGFFSSQENFAPYMIPLKYISIFKFGYQSLVTNEFDTNKPYTCSNPPDKCDQMADVDFTESFAVDMTMIGTIILLFFSISYFGLYYLVKIKL